MTLLESLLMAKKSSLLNKSYFENFKEDIEQEHVALETYQEKTKVEAGYRCKHTRLRMVGRDLRCFCGAFWTGTASEMEKIYKLLKSRETDT